MFEVYTTFFREKYLLTLTRKCGSRRGVFPKKVFFLPAEISYFTRFLTFPMSPPRGSGFDVLSRIHLRIYSGTSPGVDCRPAMRRSAGKEYTSNIRWNTRNAVR